MKERNYQFIQSGLNTLILRLVGLCEEVPSGPDREWLQDVVEDLRDISKDLRDMRREQQLTISFDEIGRR